jgi:tetratricopeptide (TPR) repeat protein
MPDQDPSGAAGKGSTIEGERMTEREENDIELIERYHQELLTPPEHQAVKARMEKDPVFAAMVADYTDIIEGIKVSGRQQITATVADWEAEIREEESQTNIIPGFFKKYWRVAAIFLLAAVAAVYIFYPVPEKTPQALYAEFFVPYEDVINVRDESNPSLTEAVHFYNEKEFKLAAERFLIYVTDNPEDLNAQFYLGLSLIESGQTGEGITSLESVIKNKGLLKEQAEWYRALAYLKMGDVAVAKNLLNEINHDGHDYQAKAVELLDRF